MPSHSPSSALRPDVLLDQQLWFLGRDIHHADGNALTRFGFRRARAETRTGSAYVLPLEGGHALVCMGFGVYLGPLVHTEELLLAPSAYGLLWRRHRRSPQLTRTGLRLPLRGLGDLPPVIATLHADQRAELHEGLQRLAAAFAHYETWALTTLGPRHRDQALAALPRHKRVRLRTLEPALSGAWVQLPM